MNWLWALVLIIGPQRWETVDCGLVDIDSGVATCWDVTGELYSDQWALRQTIVISEINVTGNTLRIRDRAGGDWVITCRVLRR